MLSTPREDPLKTFYSGRREGENTDEQVTRRCERLSLNKTETKKKTMIKVDRNLKKKTPEKIVRDEKSLNVKREQVWFRRFR